MPNVSRFNNGGKKVQPPATRGRLPDGKPSPWSKEGRKAAFVRLAEKRVPRALHEIKLLGNLARYPHEEAHAIKILQAIEDAKDKLVRQFEGREEMEQGFKLS